MNRTTTWIFVCAVAAVSLLELALAALNYLHHGRWLWVIAPLTSALGIGVMAFGAVLRKQGKPAAQRPGDAPTSRRLAGPGRTFRKA